MYKPTALTCLIALMYYGVTMECVVYLSEIQVKLTFMELFHSSITDVTIWKDKNLILTVIGEAS